jgi:RhtB (resistance to homoserine/threonine) family protein
MGDEMDVIFATYLEEIVSVGLIAVFMAISPGADFAMVTRNSIFYSRTAGIYSSLGIAFAIWVHVAYSIAGLAIIISKSIVLFSVIKYFGAAYLIYIGWKTFHAPPKEKKQSAGCTGRMSNISAFKVGFITNALNPKTTIFFLSIFTQIITPGTPWYILMIYGAIISLAHLIWFCTVTVVLTQPIMLRKFNNYRRSIERVVGSVLIMFGLKVALASSE